ncbi:MAG: hypothetical protein H0V01_13925 [Bacteroidetes bacterium]|nr:hypothetical protein [Bacteroidota bacterium]HET6245380.1 hypothetical protein [Bacteroidia bacterium]
MSKLLKSLKSGKIGADFILMAPKHSKIAVSESDFEEIWLGYYKEPTIQENLDEAKAMIVVSKEYGIILITKSK